MNEVKIRGFNQAPLVSVALITYNHSGFITECLKSVLSQSYKNIEIIIADDHSTDGTRDIIRTFAEDFPDKIKLCSSSGNVGVTKNHNRAFLACSGEYISWMSGDDIMLPNKIDKQVAFMEANPECVICYHNLEYFNTADNSTIYLKNSIDFPHEGDITTQIKFGCFNGGVSNMVRRSATPTNGFDERIPIASDWLFWVETLIGGGQIRYINEVLAKHRRHDTNVTSFDIHHPSLSEIQDHLLSAEIILSRFPAQHRAVAFRKSLIYSSLRWHENGKYYGEYLRLSLSQRFRLKILVAYLANLILGVRK